MFKQYEYFPGTRIPCSSRERETLTVVRRSLIDLAGSEDALENLGSALSEEASLFLQSFFFIEPCSWCSNTPGGMFSSGCSVGSLSASRKHSFRATMYSVVK